MSNYSNSNGIDKIELDVFISHCPLKIFTLTEDIFTLFQLQIIKQNNTYHMLEVRALF